MNDFPCKCGHLKDSHAHVMFSEKMKQFKNPSDECYFNMSGEGLLCACLNYAPDNLKYLEQLYEQSRPVL